MGQVGNLPRVDKPANRSAQPQRVPLYFANIPLLLLALFIAYGVRPMTAIIVAIGVTFVIHYAFYKLLRVPLPWGVLTRFAY